MRFQGIQSYVLQYIIYKDIIHSYLLQCILFKNILLKDRYVRRQTLL